MSSEEVLASAVEAGVLTETTATAFREHVSRMRLGSTADDERFRLVTGFNDIFVVIACGLLLASFAVQVDLASMGLVVGSVVATLGAWLHWSLRQTRRADAAFWLHLLAAPLLVHAIFGALDVSRGQATTSATALLDVAAYTALALVSLVIDRRALMVAALSYVLYAFSALLRQFGVVSLGFAITALVLGSALLLLSAYWHRSRAWVLQFLPATLQARLPPPR